MPFSKQLPAPVSHLKARLRALKQPMVWGPGIILMLIVLFTLEYWLHPEWFENTQSATNVEGGFNPAVSSEDGAIGADIDSLPLLLNQLNSAPADQAQNKQEGGKDKVATKPSLFSELLKPKNPATTQNGNSTPSNSLSAPGSATSPLLSSNGGLPSQPGDGATPGFTGLNAPGLPTTAPSALLAPPKASTIPSLNLPNTSSTPASAPVSALQTAIEQAQLQKNAAGGSTSSSTTRLDNNSTAPSSTQPYAQPNAIAPGFSNGGINYSSTPGVSSAPPSNSFNYLTQPQPDSSLPSGIAPVVPDAPAIAPVVPSTNSNPNFGQSSFSGSQNNNGFNNSGFSGNAGIQPSQLNQQPFSTPRRVPGRNIGGGQINTFSNP
ncbi:hypothetical protein [Trichocoleus sp. FACHB-591]|uniref:hypothetical protein n=1 Tax=Trichocoleus sp. FACHB-591 TaxID=2692872 RepID=UPI0016846419|nr:hypothetical protein [Trichocoleus sp. FACHB-591]